MYRDMEFDLINGEANEEASHDYIRLVIDEVAPLNLFYRGTLL